MKLAPETLAFPFPVMVGPKAMLVHEGASYSMPPEAIGIAVDNRPTKPGHFHPALRLPETIGMSDLGYDWLNASRAGRVMGLVARVT